MAPHFRKYDSSHFMAMDEFKYSGPIGARRLLADMKTDLKETPKQNPRRKLTFEERLDRYRARAARRRKHANRSNRRKRDAVRRENEERRFLKPGSDEWKAVGREQAVKPKFV